MNQENLTAEQTAQMLGIKKRTFLECYATRPDFPNRIRISRKLQYWKAEEVRQWQNRHQEQRPKLQTF